MSEKSKLEAELNFFMELEQGAVVTQMTLSKRIAVSVGLINALLKRAMHKGYVKAAAAPYKRYAYYLTPKGFSEKSRLVAEYLEASLDFFRLARKEYLDLLLRAKALSAGRIILAGSGELVEIAMSAVREANFDAGAIRHVASNATGAATETSLFDRGEYDFVLITESREPQQMFGWLAERVPEEKILAPAFLRITRHPLEFKPKRACQ